MQDVRNKNQRLNQRGFVSIFSILIIMSILSLILVGFSAVTRQAQRRTLDNQLSTQAFYAAESGINDAQKFMKNDPLATKDTCLTGGAPYFSYTLDAALNVGYSCVLVDPNPLDIRYSNVGVEGGTETKVVTMASKDGQNIDRFSVNWDSATDALLPNETTTRLPSRNTAEWGKKVGILRLDLVPKNAANGLDRASLSSHAYTLYLYPTSSGGTSTQYLAKNGVDNQGSMVLVKCNPNAALGLRCKLDIKLTPATGVLSNDYTLRMSAIYNPVQVTVDKILEPSGTTSLKLKEGQIVVDSTGRAADVFRRVQVRFPFEPNGFMSHFVVQSGDSICKRIQGKDDGSLVETGDIIPAAAAASCTIDSDPVL